jgi:peptidoglycan/LPS O-acetylase OafA/YrhL
MKKQPYILTRKEKLSYFGSVFALSFLALMTGLVILLSSLLNKNFDDLVSMWMYLLHYVPAVIVLAGIWAALSLLSFVKLNNIRPFPISIVAAFMAGFVMAIFGYRVYSDDVGIAAVTAGIGLLTVLVFSLATTAVDKTFHNQLSELD